MPVEVSAPSEQQKIWGTLALRSLLEENAERFAWVWDRPEDGKDVLETTVDGLDIELVKYSFTGEGALFLRYGGDTCGVTVTNSENGRKLFRETWDKIFSICVKQRNAVLRSVFGQSGGAIGFKSDSVSPHPNAAPLHPTDMKLRCGDCDLTLEKDGGGVHFTKPGFVISTKLSDFNTLKRAWDTELCPLCGFQMAHIPAE